MDRSGHTSRSARRAAWLALVLLSSGALGTSRAQDHAQAVHRPLPSADELKKLPPDGGPDYNRLVFEKSPYLLQHATNPVDWFPWAEEAFAKAHAENKPIFLSIGYSTCHWCHVMEKESFEDPEVAALLNKEFVAIKVDREERPDVDQLYMAVTQAITGSGGWPMTIVMTPDKQPFFAGTYFPKHGVHGGAGLMEILTYLADAWKTQHEKVVTEAGKVVAAIRAQALAGESAQAGGPLALGPSTLERAYQELSQRFDPEQGGFGSAPKFPIPHQLRFLLRYGQRTGDAHALEMVERTLDAMARGGIRDHVGFGFHRYSTDRQWLVPHFEKMLYDQASIATAYVEAFEITHASEYRDIARQTFEYVLRDMRSPEGGFYCAEDADSAGGEGLFYTWTQAELVSVLGEPDAHLFAEVYGVPAASAGAASNPEAGRSILHQVATWAALAAKLGLPEAELRARIESMRKSLFEAREKRLHPLKDDKILTDWNGWMIAALAQGARAFDEPRYTAAAERAADFVIAHLTDDEGRLHKRYRLGAGGQPAAVDDYAFFVWGLIQLYETDFDARWLERAIALERTFTAEFWDEKSGGYFFTPKDGEALFARSKEVYDGALPSGNSVAALDLLFLSRITGDPAYEARAEGIFKAFATSIARQPSAHTQMMIALEFASSPSLEIVIAGRADAPDTRAMVSALRARFLPQAVVLLRPDGDDPPIARIAAFTKDQAEVGGKATAYVCRNFACEKPTVDVEAMMRSVAARMMPAGEPASSTPAAAKKPDKP